MFSGLQKHNSNLEIYPLQNPQIHTSSPAVTFHAHNPAELHSQFAGAALSGGRAQLWAPQSPKLLPDYPSPFTPSETERWKFSCRVNTLSKQPCHLPEQLSQLAVMLAGQQGHAASAWFLPGSGFPSSPLLPAHCDADVKQSRTVDSASKK